MSFVRIVIKEAFSDEAPNGNYICKAIARDGTGDELASIEIASVEFGSSVDLRLPGTGLLKTISVQLIETDLKKPLGQFILKVGHKLQPRKQVVDKFILDAQDGEIWADFFYLDDPVKLSPDEDAVLRASRPKTATSSVLSPSSGKSEEDNLEDALPKFAVAKFDFVGEMETDLSVPADQVIRILEEDGEGWWRAEFQGKSGWVPSNFFERLSAEASQSFIDELRAKKHGGEFNVPLIQDGSVLCENCDESSPTPATEFCKDCEAYLCDSCSETIHTENFFKIHRRKGMKTVDQIHEEVKASNAKDAERAVQKSVAQAQNADFAAVRSAKEADRMSSEVKKMYDAMDAPAPKADPKKLKGLFGGAEEGEDEARPNLPKKASTDVDQLKRLQQELAELSAAKRAEAAPVKAVNASEEELRQATLRLEALYNRFKKFPKVMQQWRETIQSTEQGAKENVKSCFTDIDEKFSSLLSFTHDYEKDLDEGLKLTSLRQIELLERQQAHLNSYLQYAKHMNFMCDYLLEHESDWGETYGPVLTFSELFQIEKIMEEVANPGFSQAPYVPKTSTQLSFLPEKIPKQIKFGRITDMAEHDRHRVLYQRIKHDHEEEFYQLSRTIHAGDIPYFFVIQTSASNPREVPPVVEGVGFSEYGIDTKKDLFSPDQLGHAWVFAQNDKGTLPPHLAQWFYLHAGKEPVNISLTLGGRNPENKDGQEETRVLSLPQPDRGGDLIGVYLDRKNATVQVFVARYTHALDLRYEVSDRIRLVAREWYLSEPQPHDCRKSMYPIIKFRGLDKGVAEIVTARFVDGREHATSLFKELTQQS